jgi:D-alanine-D-alanine ligase-like ATP-grasp enzyme
MKINWDPTRYLAKRLDLNDTVGKGVADVALRAWRVLGCRDAGRIDICHDGKDPLSATPNFLEVDSASFSCSCV